jgi:hypothetical protein
MSVEVSDCYTVPPEKAGQKKLFFVLVQVSERRYAIAEYGGSAALPPTNVLPLVDHTWQAGLTYRLVSKPMPYLRAIDELAYRIGKRVTDRPIIL